MCDLLSILVPPTVSAPTATGSRVAQAITARGEDVPLVYKTYVFEMEAENANGPETGVTCQADDR